MYEERLGTDWEAVDREEALRRAYALGVAESLDEDPPDGELERLVEQVEGRYGRSLVELAYDEGRNQGSRPPSSESSAAVWSSLVESDGEPLTGPTRGATPGTSRPARRTDLPESISVPAFLESRRDDLAKLGFPEFLR